MSLVTLKLAGIYLGGAAQLEQQLAEEALPLLGEDPFLLVNGDVWTDFDFALLPPEPAGLAHLVMVDPPAHAPGGDFALGEDGIVRGEGAYRLTYSGIGVYRPHLLDGWQVAVGDRRDEDGKPKFRLAPILRARMAEGAITGMHHRGRWTDVGTPQRLAQLDAELRAAGA